MRPKLGPGAREGNQAREGRAVTVSDKPLGMKHSQVLACREEPELAPSRVAGVARGRRNEKTAPIEMIGCAIIGGQEAKTEILV